MRMKPLFKSSLLIAATVGCLQRSQAPQNDISEAGELIVRMSGTGVTPANAATRRRSCIISFAGAYVPTMSPVTEQVADEDQVRDRREVLRSDVLDTWVGSDALPHSECKSGDDGSPTLPQSFDCISQCYQWASYALAALTSVPAAPADIAEKAHHDLRRFIDLCPVRAGTATDDDLEFLSYWPLDYIWRIYLHPVSNALLEPDERTGIECMMANWAFDRSRYSDAVLDPVTKTRNVWRIWGSENHHAHHRSATLLAVQVLQSLDVETLADGQPVTAHYTAWNEYWKTFLRQLAREGISAEIGATEYMATTLNAYYNLRDFAKDPDLAALADQFLTLYWADIANDFLPGAESRAGATTRTYKTDVLVSGSQALRPHYYLNGWLPPGVKPWDFGDHPPPRTKAEMLVATSNYRVPDVVTSVAHRHCATFEYTSRRWGRARPGEPGVDSATEQFAVAFTPNQDSNIIRYTFRTPEYVLGTMSYSTASVHTESGTKSETRVEFARQDRSMGVVFNSNRNARVVIFGDYYKTTLRGPCDHWATAGSEEINGVAWRDAAIIGPGPGLDPVHQHLMFFVPSTLISTSITSGQRPWMFVTSGDAYVAIGPAAGSFQPRPVRNNECNESADDNLPGCFNMFRCSGKCGTDADAEAYCPYSGSESGLGVVYEISDATSPLLLILGRAAEESFATFQHRVLNTSVVLSAERTKLTLRGRGGATLSWDMIARQGAVDGAGIDWSLNPEATYDSPYLWGKHGCDNVWLSDGSLIREMSFGPYWSQACVWSRAMPMPDELLSAQQRVMLWHW